MSDAGVVIFRSVQRAACDERAFVLSAVGIASELGRDDTEFVLTASHSDAPQALMHLRQYQQELNARLGHAQPPTPPLHPGAWIGCVVYTGILFYIAFAIARGQWRLDAFDVGELDAGLVRSGQWWRSWTALTLHVDGAHLMANTVAGVWFGYLAARLMGGGTAWFLIVLGAGCANWLEAYFAPASHRAVGASTAVFAALGLLSAFSWRARYRYPARWARRWAPLVAGMLLLAWTGSGGGDLNDARRLDTGVDVLAHALGFVLGVGLGVGTAVRRVSVALDRVPQWLKGLGAVSVIAIAWARALGS
jgi:rhomboid protease GluP